MKASKLKQDRISSVVEDVEVVVAAADKVADPTRNSSLSLILAKSNMLRKLLQRRKLIQLLLRLLLKSKPHHQPILR